MSPELQLYHTDRFVLSGNFGNLRRIGLHLGLHVEVLELEEKFKARLKSRYEQQKIVSKHRKDSAL